MPMTILPFPAAPTRQPGALEAVRDYLDRVHPARGHGETDCGAFFDGSGELPAGDHMLAWLWERGFKVVPI
ncbi:hypothetical protein [Bradyrhizobium liaoningense]